MKRNLFFNQVTAIGKRLAMVLTMLLIVGIGQAWGADYELVTSAPSDWSGEYLIVAGTSALSGGTSSWGTTTTVTVTNNKISTTANISVTISKGGTSGTYYIYMNSNSKYLKEVTSNTFATADASSTDTEWKISLSNGNAQIACASSTTRYLRLNGTSGYRCYTSATGTLPKLYKKAASYTITAQSNNTNYGTVSLSGTTITASPKTGYRVSTTTPYTISPSGAAKVTQSENKFTVTPTANCTITINFEALPKYTVTFHTTATAETERTEASAGAGVNPPTMEKECGEWTFMGWSESSSNSETSTTPLSVVTLTNEKYYPTKDIDLYPVYTKSEGGGGTEYVLTDIGEISSGDIFVFADASNYALTNNNGTSSAVGVKQITVSNSKITSTVDATIEWQLTGNNTNGYTFYPGTGTTTWLYCNTTASSSNNNNMRVGTGDRKLFVVNNNGYLVTNDTYTDRYLSRYNTQDFRGYTNTNTNPVKPKLYKKTAGSTTYYYSYPQCTIETSR